MFDRNLCDLEQEIKKEHRNWCNFIIHNLEEVSEFFSGDINKVSLSDFFRLIPNPVFTLNVIVFTHKLEKLECTPVSNYTFFVVDLLINCDRFKYIFSKDIFFINIIKVIVVYCGW